MAKLTVLHVFPILWSNWECDPQAVVALKEDGTKVALLWRSPVNEGDILEVELSMQDILSNHVLRGKIAEYTEAVESTKAALSLLEDGFITLNYSY